MSKQSTQLETVYLADVLKSVTRETRLLGTVSDPVAQELLGSISIAALDKQLSALGIKNLRPLNAGASSVVLDAGEKVVRIGHGDSIPRPNIAEVLQAEHAGSVGGLRFEVLPKVDTKNITEDDVRQLQAQLSERGYKWGDAAPDNVGRFNGKLVVTDPGGLERDYSQSRANAVGEKRADAFLNLPKTDALAKFPELHATFESAAKAENRAKATFFGNPAGVVQVMDSFRLKVAEQLRAGQLAKDIQRDVLRDRASGPGRG